jgi:hypothetical protein
VAIQEGPGYRAGCRFTFYSSSIGLFFPHNPHAYHNFAIFSTFTICNC